MNKLQYRKAHSDLRRILVQGLPQAGKFWRIDEGPTTYVYHAVMQNLIAAIDLFEQDGERVAVLQYRPKSIYRDLLREMCYQMGAKRVLALPGKRIGRHTEVIRTLPYEIVTENRQRRERFNSYLAAQLKQEKLRDPFCLGTESPQPRIVTWERWDRWRVDLEAQ